MKFLELALACLVCFVVFPIAVLGFFAGAFCFGLQLGRYAYGAFSDHLTKIGRLAAIGAEMRTK